MRRYLLTSLSVALLSSLPGCGGRAPTPVKAPEPVAVAAPVEEEAEPEEWVPENVAQSSFEVSVSAIQPGAKFLIAARFEIEPGYRLGWVNPGDVGKATRITLKAPAGFEVSAPMFPAPERYDLGHGLKSYGYKDRLVIFFEVKAPKKLSFSRVNRFDVNASWLGCKKECVSEETNAFFELTSSWQRSKIEFEPEVQAQLDRLPLRLEDLKEAKQAWRSKKTMSVKAADTRWKDFFPASGKMQGASFDANQLLVHYSESPQGEDELGVARAEVAGKEHFVTIPSAMN